MKRDAEMGRSLADADVMAKLDAMIQVGVALSHCYCGILSLINEHLILHVFSLFLISNLVSD